MYCKTNRYFITALAMLFLMTSCALPQTGAQGNYAPEVSGAKDAAKSSIKKQSVSLINPQGNTIEERFLPPEGFKRTKTAPNSFGAYLRSLPLKPEGSLVKYFNGKTKANDGVYEAVVDMEIGDRDLQQCADAVMRLWAEHLFRQQKFDAIHFNFLNGFRTEYSKWMAGNRIAVDGNKTWWVKKAEPSNTYKDFRSYMDMVFAYANTLSLIKELKQASVQDIQPGDVFIDDRHAIIVVDTAESTVPGKKLFLLAQSYMPAQETQVLKNPDSNQSPWYSTDFGEILKTPEWTFKRTDLYRFPGAE